MLSTTGKSLTLALLATLAMSLTDCVCKVESVLKDANLSLAEVDGSNIVSMMTEIDTSKLIISAATLQISGGLGNVELLSDITTGKSYVKISFRLGKALKLPNFNYMSRLPNGLTVPLTGVDLTRMMAFDVGTKGSKLYLYYDATNKKSILGLALNVETLSTGASGAILGAFTLGNVTGVAGLYTGTATNSSGVAIFADLSGIFLMNNSDLAMAARTPIGFVERKATDAQLKLMENKYNELVRSGKAIRIK